MLSLFHVLAALETLIFILCHESIVLTTYCAHEKDLVLPDVPTSTFSRALEFIRKVKLELAYQLLVFFFKLLVCFVVSDYVDHRGFVC